MVLKLKLAEVFKLAVDKLKQWCYNYFKFLNAMKELFFIQVGFQRVNGWCELTRRDKVSLIPEQNC